MHKTGIKESGSERGRASTVYDQIVHSVAAYLHTEGFLSVKANCEGFSLPDKVKWDDDDEGVVPDITGERHGALYVFEIQNCDDLEAKNVEDRWRLFTAYAKRNHGKFYLVVPEEKAGYLREFSRNLSVQPEYLQLTGLA